MESPPAIAEPQIAGYFSELSSKLEELKDVYQINSTLMKQRDEEIESLKRQVLSLTSQLASVTTQLSFAKETIGEKDEEIVELEALILMNNMSPSPTSEEEFEVDEELEPSEPFPILSPIPEENIDEIPDYYDEW